MADQLLSSIRAPRFATDHFFAPVYVSDPLNPLPLSEWHHLDSPTASIQ
jgi:hypothetical protein